MKYLRFYILILIIGLGAGYVGSQLNSTDSAVEAKTETAYERVMRTGTLRCGYSSWQPLFWVDANTKEVHGIFADLTKEIARRLELQIEWKEELGWGAVTESINSGRVDMACAGYWLHPSRVLHLSSTYPQIYAPLYVWTRAEDAETPKSLEEIDSQNYKIGLVDGGSSGQIIDNYFPNAARVEYSQSSTNGDLVAGLLSKKFDFFIDDVTSFMAYNKDNPGKLRILFDQPLAVFPATMLLPKGDQKLKETLDNTLLLIKADGTLEKILEKYDVKDKFLRDISYQESKG